MKTKELENPKELNCTYYNTPFEMTEVVAPVFPNTIITVDAIEKDNGIQESIDRCSSLGGGIVVIPPGKWYSNGAIHLHSNIKLVIEEDATIEFTKEFSAYLPVVFTRWEGIECYNYSPFIYAKDCENIAVVGKGKLLGNGNAWWHWKELQAKAAYELCNSQIKNRPVSERIYGSEIAALRPSFIQFINCKNIQLQGLTIEDGPQWTVHPVYCENVLIQGLTITTNGHNTDGLNPDSCKNVVIEDCTFSTGDDCIAINSGMNEDGWRVNKPCENVIIRNCKMYEGHGAIVIGSGMSGGVRNIYATNNYVDGGMWGLRIKSMRGRGGYVDNIWIENMEINNTSNEAIQISMFYNTTTVVPASVTPAEFSRIHLKNITGKNKQAVIVIKGLPEQNIKDITLENVNLASSNILNIQDVDQLKIV